MSVAGFDFHLLNSRYLSSSQPVNKAASYGAGIIPAPANRAAWRCIGIYHLSPTENRGRHNVFVDVLDETGKRTNAPTIRWTWWIDGPTQTTRLDKPADEPACDIPLESKATVTLWVDGDSLPSDRVGNLHSRHRDEGDGNTWGHHSYYIVFQRQGVTVAPPVEPEPEPQPDELARLRKENAQLRSIILSALTALEGGLA